MFCLEVIEMNTKSVANNKNEGTPERLAKVLTIMGDLMELAIVGFIFVMVVFSKNPYVSLLYNDKSRELGLLMSVIIYVGMYSVFSTAGILGLKEEYRKRAAFLFVGWMASVLCFAVFANDIKWQEFLASGSPIILWASASFFLRSLLPEEDETKQ